MKITIIGTGYVGLVTGACLADLGNDVVCLDVDTRKVALLRAGTIPIHEPGLADMVHHNAKAGRLRFSTDAREAALHGQVQFIAVGTPPGEDGSADLQYVLAAAHAIGQHMDGPRIIVNKSTVPVGTAAKVRETIQGEIEARSANHRFSVVSNPEFLKEGAAIEDFMRPDRIVVGSDDDHATSVMRQLYAPFERKNAKLIVMDIRSAELTKYAANAMLATRISFMNEMALLAEALGADIDAVRRGVGSDPRIGSSFLYAGCGYGGSCFPKDVKALLRTAEQADLPMHVLDAVEHANERQKHVLIGKIEKRFGSDLTGRVFAIWGLAFKPETDDMRHAPSLVVIGELQQRGAHVQAYDPVAMAEARRLLGGDESLVFSSSAMEALAGADALVVVTEWKEFRSPDFERMKAAMRRPHIFDGRNILDSAVAVAAGFDYTGIGKNMIDFAIIGCGRIAKRHAELLGTGQIAGARLAAVCDIQRDRAEAFGAKYGVPAFASIEAMLATQGIDAVSVLTPSGMHSEHAIQVARSKRHVLVEKPMALTLTDADAMIRECDAAGVGLYVVKQNRFNVPVQKAREALEAGRFGKLVLGTVRVRWCRDQSYYSNDNWRGTWAQDGGVLSNQASHHVDMLSWFMGGVESVHARGATALVAIEAEDTAVATIKFRNGALGIIEATSASRPKDMEGSLSVLGATGAVEIAGFSVNKIRTWQFTEPAPADADVMEKFSVNPPNVYGFGHQAYYEHMVDVLSNGAKPLVDGHEGRQSLELIMALYESIASGREVRLPLVVDQCKLGRQGGQ